MTTTYKRCRRVYPRGGGRARCFCTTKGGQKRLAPMDYCDPGGPKAACVPASIKYVKGGGCWCKTKSGGGKFISKSICKRKYKK